MILDLGCQDYESSVGFFSVHLYFILLLIKARYHCFVLFFYNLVCGLLWVFQDIV